MKRNFILLNAICCLFSSNMALADASSNYFNLVQSGEALTAAKRVVICLDAASYDCQNYTVTHENLSISSNIAGHTYKKAVIKTTESTPQLMSLGGLLCNSSGTECDFEISDTTSVVVPVESSDQSKYFLGGSISGLPQTSSSQPGALGLVLHNSENDDDISVPLGAKSYVFNTRVSNTNAYQISVSQNPTGYSCTVAANYKGTVNNDNVGNINIECNKASTSQWQRITSNIATPVITSLFKAFAVDPSNSQTVYVASEASSSVFKSTDGGLNWTDKSSGLFSSQFWKIKVDPFNSNIVYLASNSGVFKTTDAGGSWNLMNNGLPTSSGNVLSIALDPTHQNTLYAGFSGSQGIYKSTNGGQSWSSINNNLPATGLSVYSITLKPGDSNVLFIGASRTANEVTTQSIFRSDDAGVSWVESDAGIADNFNRIYKILIDPSNSNICYAATRLEGAYKSIDGCENWSKMTNLNVNSVYDMVIDPSNSNTLIAGSNGKIYKTTDAGDAWQDITGTLTTPALFYTLIYSGDTLLQGTLSGELSRSENNGTTWAASNTGIIEYSAQQVETLLTTSSSIIAALFDVGIFKSIDNGNNWADITSDPLNPAGLWRLVQNPNNDNVIYVAADGQGVLKTTDGGVTWSAKNTGFPAGYSFGAFTIDPNTPDTLFVDNIDSAGGLFKTTDGGDSWTLIPFFNDNSFVYSVAIDKNNSQVVYATKSIDNTIAKSIDGGENWLTILSTASEPVGLSIDPNDSEIVYVAAGNIVYKSLDSGATWKTYSSGLTDGLVARTDIAINPENSQHLYLGTNNRGVYYSVNGGKSWSARNAGLESSAVNVLKFEPSTHKLYAGTPIKGVFSLTP